jgi:Prokaryotic dksA/traR C4-type zinc finger
VFFVVQTFSWPLCVYVFSYELKCRRCGWRTVCGRDDAIARLRLIGLLRREPDPEESVVGTLLVEAAPRMTCPICKEKTLAAAPVESVDEDDWLAARLCEICRQPIPSERLEALPGATCCASCQQKSDTGELRETEPEYCPQCGALVELRMSRGPGITRYKRVCTGIPPCRL